jgi:hypothetical protein
MECGALERFMRPRRISGGIEVQLLLQFYAWRRDQHFGLADKRLAQLAAVSPNGSMDSKSHQALLGRCQRGPRSSTRLSDHCTHGRQICSRSRRSQNSSAERARYRPVLKPSRVSEFKSLRLRRHMNAFPLSLSVDQKPSVSNRPQLSRSESFCQQMSHRSRRDGASLQVSDGR